MSARIQAPVLSPPKGDVSPPTRVKVVEGKPINNEVPIQHEPQSQASENPQVETGSTLKTISRCLFDSILRGFARFVEKFVDSQLLRVLYRFGTESVRKLSEVLFNNYLENSKLTKKQSVTGITRALEHLPATSFVEPNLYEDYLPRILAGFGNMSLRFATRFGFYKTKAISHEELGVNHILDEFLSRSLLRGVFVKSDNPIIGIGVRTLEQFLININLHVFRPLGRLFPQFPELLSKKFF